MKFLFFFVKINQKKGDTMMRDCNIEELDYLNMIGKGDTSTVFKVRWKKKDYAFKKFDNPEIILNESTEEKIRGMLNLKISRCIFPMHIIEDNGKSVGYITEPRVSTNLNSIKDFRLKEKVRILRDCKNVLDNLHENGIVHCNIDEDSFFLNSYNLHDFDHSFYNNIKPDINFLSPDCQKYVKKYGFSEDVDAYLFNKMTHKILELDGINSYYSHLFNMDEYNEILKSVINPENNHDCRYLIDTTDAYQKVKVY